MSFVTVLKTDNSCNKVWDGERMSFNRPFTQAVGYTQRIESVNDLHSLIKRMSDKEGCVLIPGGYFPQYAEHDMQFNVMAATEMKRRGIVDVAGIHSIGGNDYIARLKNNMKPSNVILWDYDQADGMPDEWLNKSPDELVSFMRSILGEDVGFVAVGSTSARCKGLDKGKGCHLYCLIEDASDLERFKAAWMAQGFTHGWSFLKPTHCRKDIPKRGLKAGDICSYVPWGVFDPSVLASCERLDFIGKPDGKGVIVVLPAKIVIYDGVPADTTIIKSLDVEQHKQVKAALKTAGISLTNGDGFNASVVGGISLSDSVDTEAGNITVSEFISGQYEKLRCQIPSHIRDSNSWNGILRMTGKGTALLYDQGTRTSYFLPDSDVVNIESSSTNWDEPVPLPDTLLPVDSFDADMLPSVFRDYALDVSSRMQCPIEFVAVSIMTTFGGVVGKRCSIHPKAHDDWLVVPNLWGALVGRPSTMKSPAITAATAGVDGLVKEARSEFAEACSQAEINGMIYDAEKKSFKDAITKAVVGGKDIPTAKPEKPSQPVEQRYITNAGTVENLIKLLSENENGIIQLRDELMGWIRSMDNPSSQDARSFYLEAWNGTGSSFSYDTMSHGHLCLETGACVAVLGGVQPSLLAGIVHGAEVGNAGDDGMLQRFQLLVYPDKDTTWKYCDRKPNNAFSMALKTAFKGVVDLSGKLHFDVEAQPIFIDWYSKLMHRLKHEDHLGMESHLSKYPQLMPAIALLIHLAEHAAQGNTTALGEVNKRAALKAVAWCDFLETHARRIYAMGDRLGVDAAKKVITQVLAGKLSNPFTLGELQRKNLSGLKGEQAIQSIEMLEQYGWIRTEVKTTPQGGRPTTICTLHPMADFFLKRPDTPLTKLTKPIKRGFSELREGGVGHFAKKKEAAEKPRKADIERGKVGELGGDGRVIRAEPANSEAFKPEHGRVRGSV
ncbi:MAG: DUF3987 domain-containing protein [Mariprofundus sp.]|nr:DUF3987 domain-containing protein [Mariprofundus sp.]